MLQFLVGVIDQVERSFDQPGSGVDKWRIIPVGKWASESVDNERSVVREGKLFPQIIARRNLLKLWICRGNEIICGVF